MKILLLEDNKVLHESLKEYLSINNFKIHSAFNSDDVYSLTYKNKYDLYLFDINVPGDNGFKILKYLKDAQDFTPTIYITARTDIDSLQQGFNVGASDYIRKPFDPEELVIRIKNRFMPKELIHYKHLKYNISTKEIYKDDVLVRITQTLSDIFHVLIINKNKLIENNTLLDLLPSQSNTSLRVNISKLKKQLNINITNIRSQGYMIEDI
jgi:DNA-binding response OmpR family regulator